MKKHNAVAVPRRMKAKEFKQLLLRNNLTQAEVAELFLQGERTARRHANDEATVPGADSIILRLLDRGIISLEQVKRAAAGG